MSTNNPVINEEIDLDGDGKLSKDESQIAQTKFKNRRRMAWIALLSMIACMIALISPLVSVEKITALDSIIGYYYLAMASVVGAYMGFTTWASLGSKK